MKTQEEKKEAKKIANAKYREDNKELIKKINKKYRENNLEKIKKSNDEWCEKNKNYYSEYYEKNKEKIKLNNKNYKSENEVLIKLMNKKYYNDNKNIILFKMNKRYLSRNKIIFNGIRRKYYKKVNYIMAWRGILKRVLIQFGESKESHTIDLLGYSSIELKDHITSLFTDGMSWNNYGEWHIDHIKPVASFNKETTPNIVNALSNLRPMWATTREINGVIYEGNLNRIKLRITS